jgi:hypothetical protein
VLLAVLWIGLSVVGQRVQAQGSASR